MSAQVSSHSQKDECTVRPTLDKYQQLSHERRSLRRLIIHSAGAISRLVGPAPK